MCTNKHTDTHKHTHTTHTQHTHTYTHTQHTLTSTVKAAPKNKSEQFKGVRFHVDQLDVVIQGGRAYQVTDTHLRPLPSFLETPLHGFHGKVAFRL